MSKPFRLVVLGTYPIRMPITPLPRVVKQRIHSRSYSRSVTREWLLSFLNPEKASKKGLGEISVMDSLQQRFQSVAMGKEHRAGTKEGDGERVGSWAVLREMRGGSVDYASGDGGASRREHLRELKLDKSDYGKLDVIVPKAL